MESNYKCYPKIQSLLNILTHQNKINSNKSLRKRREKQKDEENNVKFNNEFLAKLDLYIQKSKDEESSKSPVNPQINASDQAVNPSSYYSSQAQNLSNLLIQRQLPPSSSSSHSQTPQKPLAYPADVKYSSSSTSNSVIQAESKGSKVQQKSRKLLNLELINWNLKGKREHSRASQRTKLNKESCKIVGKRIGIESQSKCESMQPSAPVTPNDNEKKNSRVKIHLINDNLKQTADSIESEGHINFHLASNDTSSQNNLNNNIFNRQENKDMKSSIYKEKQKIIQNGKLSIRSQLVIPVKEIGRSLSKKNSKNNAHNINQS